MKKKIGLLVAMLVFVLSFTGCASSASNDVEYNKDSLEQIAETVILSFAQMSDDVLQQFKDGSELEVNLTLMQGGLPADKDAFVGMIDAWQAALEECGAYEGHGDFKAETTKDGISLVAKGDFADRDADITVSFDEKLQLESMTIDAHYSTGEILKKAGLNTLLGMGTVFVVLIFISFIISLFNYIPAIQAKFSKKKEEPAVSTVEETPAETANTEELSDDLELVAVISAAIAAHEGTSTDGFVVRSIKRRKTNKWIS